MRIALTGDIGLFGKFSRLQKTEISSYFSELKELFDTCDYVVGNLETPLVDSEKEFFYKSAYISAPTSSIKILNFLGFTHVNLANNHLGDYGHQGIDKTISTLEKAKIDWFGINGKMVNVYHEGNKVAFSGYCNFDTNALLLGKIGINPLKPKIVKSSINNDYLNIISIHSGIEHVDVPSPFDMSFARSLSDNNMVYYGHHPHVIQGYENINRAHVFYSLGNLIFDDVRFKCSNEIQVPLLKKNRIGLIPVLTVKNSQVEQVEMFFTEITDNKIIVKSQYSYFDEICGYLSMSSEEINQKRNEMLSQRRSDSSRDISWYVKRLRAKYIFIKLNGLRNRYRHKKFYRNEINDSNTLG